MATSTACECVSFPEDADPARLGVAAHEGTSGGPGVGVSAEAASLGDPGRGGNPAEDGDAEQSGGCCGEAERCGFSCPGVGDWQRELFTGVWMRTDPNGEQVNCPLVGTVGGEAVGEESGGLAVCVGDTGGASLPQAHSEGGGAGAMQAERGRSK